LSLVISGLFLKLLTQNVAIAIFGLDGLSWENLVDARENFIHALGNDIFPDIEQNVSTLFCNLVLRYGYPQLIIILVPLSVVRIFGHAHVVPIG
jgi:hypothetical protein